MAALVFYVALSVMLSLAHFMAARHALILSYFLPIWPDLESKLCVRVCG